MFAGWIDMAIEYRRLTSNDISCGHWKMWR
jgi:hypothetical protein